MKTAAIAALVLALASGAGLAHHGRLQEHLLSAKVLSAGRYAQHTEGFVRTATHAAAGALVAPFEETARIPLRAGERFGFCFEAEGFLDDGEVDLQKIVTHPPAVVAGRVADGYVNEVELIAAGGTARGCIGHTMAADERRAGEWTIALGAGETTLVSRRFTLE